MCVYVYTMVKVPLREVPTSRLGEWRKNEMKNIKLRTNAPKGRVDCNWSESAGKDP